MALECSLDWRRIGTQRCGCGCGSFRAVFKHRPTDEFVGVEVACGQGEGGTAREVVGSGDRMPRRWAAWAWET
ncbi:MAG: hypothetical protein NVSMB65_19230 [Chloroflexota bacterium]